MALDSYYASQAGDDIADSQAQASDPTPSQTAPPPGPVPASSNPGPSSSSSATAPRTNPPKQKKKFGSLRDLQASESAESDNSDDKDQQYFAGGDKSGLAVQDPSNNNDGPMSANEHIQRLLHTARQNKQRPQAGNADEEDDDAQPRENNFRGAGVTLGGEGTGSRVIPDPDAPSTSQPPRRAQPNQMIERTLHLWEDGFSVDDGPLYRYDDPRNARTLEMINRGSAPLDLMNVETGQAVDVKLEQHRDEKYVRPKKKYRPFEGQGNRLGAPTPGAPATTTNSATATTAPSTNAAAVNAEIKPDIDSSQPSVRLQIRLADGTRLPAQFNTNATIGDVQAFVRRAHAESGSREFVLATTFPTKELVDSAAVIGEVSELKRGGNVVQKWV